MEIDFIVVAIIAFCCFYLERENKECNSDDIDNKITSMNASR